MRVTDYIAESPKPRFIDAVRLDESVLVLGDVEIPFHNAAWINQCIDLARAWGISTLGLAGDFVHWGSLAHFFESEKTTDDEIADLEQTIAGFVKNFNKIIYISGNHDRRPMIALDRFVKLDRMSRLIIPPDLAAEWQRKVVASDYYYFYVGDDWIVEHPKATNTVPANAARALAQASGRSVLMAHNHLFGMQQTADGKHYGIEIGCCVDYERLAYYMTRHTTRPKMSTGAAILRKVGEHYYPTLLSPKWTDFEWEKQKGNQKRSSGGSRRRRLKH